MLNIRILRAFVPAIIQVCALVARGEPTRSRPADFTPREYYGARLEPVSNVLHGAGQVNWRDADDYRRALGVDPCIFVPNRSTTARPCSMKRTAGRNR